jgi:uncharacterized protein (TIGR02147 family)
MNNPIKSPNIFDYLDHKEFLKEYQLYRQGQDNSFSKSQFSRMLGMPNTRSYFNDVLKGKAITASFVERFTQALALDSHQAKYFRLLVQFNQSPSSQERELAYDQLIHYRRNKIHPTIIDEMEYYQNWYNGAIRSLLDIIDTKGDIQQISRSLFPKISSAKITESLQLLQRLQLIAPNTKGYLKPTHKHTFSSSYSSAPMVRQYQCQQIDLLKQFILQNTKEPGNTSTTFVTVSSKAYIQIEKQLQSFKQNIRTIIDSDQEPANKLYLLTNALTPLTIAPTPAGDTL